MSLSKSIAYGAKRRKMANGGAVREDDYESEYNFKEGNDHGDDSMLKEPPAHGHGMEHDPDEPAPYVRQLADGGIVDEEEAAKFSEGFNKALGEPTPSPEPSNQENQMDSKNIAMMARKRKMAEGGVVSKEIPADSDAFEHDMQPDGEFDDEPMSDDSDSEEFLAEPDSEAKRGRLQRIMSQVRMGQTGRK